MRIKIARADPSGNSTILVLTSVEASERSAVAAKLMQLDGGWAEQVGFVSFDNGKPRLDMMGGEFCGNASMSLAAFLAKGRGLDEAEIALSVSGTPEPVVCTVHREKEAWKGSVSMPLPESVAREELSFEGQTFSYWTVRFQGIVHIIVPEGELSRMEAEKALRKWARDIKAAALGIMLFSESELAMKPLIYVKETDSMVWERGCGSGTSAVGAYLAVSGGQDVKAAVKQPGGIIEVQASVTNGSAVSLSIKGTVRLLGESGAEI